MRCNDSVERYRLSLTVCPICRWQAQTAAALGLESALRRQGRPKKITETSTENLPMNCLSYDTSTSQHMYEQCRSLNRFPPYPQPVRWGMAGDEVVTVAG